MAMKLPINCESIIDVTKPPYNADNTGKVDCTHILNKIVDDVLSVNIAYLEKTEEKLMEMPDSDAKIGFEVCKRDGVMNVIFSEVAPPAKIIYFPKGIYQVSDTITYSHENLQNIFGGVRMYEYNSGIHFKGESREEVVIRLQDNCKGFGYGADKPVISFMRGEASNIAMNNTFEDITIDIGKGNSGAVGLVFFANNTGCVKNVRMRSSDCEYKGYAGLEILHEIVSGCYVKNIEVEGFDYGIRSIPVRHYVTFENVTLSYQRKAGIGINNTIACIHNLKSDNTVPAVKIDGTTAHVAVVDGEFYGGSPLYTAIEYKMGLCYIRNIKTSGYRAAINCKIDGSQDDIDEYCSEKAWTLFDEKAKGLGLPIMDVPKVDLEYDQDECAFVEAYGAAGDGKTDDTEAIQRAMNSGRKCIFFQSRRYFIDGVITIPETVQRVNFMYCDFVAGDYLIKSDAAAFRLIGESEKPLLLEDAFVWEGFYGRVHFIEQANTRTLIMSDLHTQTAAMYYNSVEGGTVFIENCGCTVAYYDRPLYRDMCPYAFKGQTVYARNINPERAFLEIINDGGTLWVMGFKAEFEGVFVRTVNGGKTEIIGGVISIGNNKGLPVLENIDSDVSAVMSSNGYGKDDFYPIAVKEVRGNEEKILHNDQLPKRLFNCFMIPLYSGCNQGKDGIEPVK